MRATRSRGKSKGRSTPQVLPQPKRIRSRRGAFRLEPGSSIQLPDDGEPLSRALQLTAESFRNGVEAKTGVSLDIERAREPGRSGAGVHCRIDSKAALDPTASTARDAYRLTIGARGIEIASPSQAGLCFGLQTLGQLVKGGGKARIDALEILDQPDFRDRGIMLDVSRGRVPTQKTLESLVGLCARLRLNVLMLYVEHTFAFRRHPEISEGVSALTAEAILSLDAYAADRGVELIPCLQSLGHMEHVLSLPRYAHLAARLDRIAQIQSEQLDALVRLWLARSEISEFEKTKKRARKSINDLRSGAKRLRAGTAPKPPKEKTLGLLDVFNEMRLQFGMPPR